jgi:hypothetical protein
LIARLNGKYLKPVITYHVPVSGSEDLLRVRPNPFSMNSERVYVTNGCICFDTIDCSGDADAIKRQADGIHAGSA